LENYGDSTQKVSLSFFLFDLIETLSLIDLIRGCEYKFRLLKFDRKNWRVSYNALILLENLLTHGPRRVAEEFQCDKDVIKEIGSFQYIDERGLAFMLRSLYSCPFTVIVVQYLFVFTCSFNWGLRVRSLSERVLKLLESEPFLKEERGRARKLTHGIQGFGSFCLWSSSTEATLKNSCFEIYGRCNPHYNENSSIREGTRRARQTHQDLHSVPKEPENDSGSGQGLGDGYAGEDHPFCNNANRTVASLISTNE
jgi:epsin